VLKFFRLIPYAAMRAAYRAAQHLHPDHGGNAEDITVLNKLWDIFDANVLSYIENDPDGKRHGELNVISDFALALVASQAPEKWAAA
jgi:hypothetical protein